jgi:hypothetical protein
MYHPFFREETRQRLGLKVEETNEATLAGGVKIPSKTKVWI